MQQNALRPQSLPRRTVAMFYGGVAVVVVMLGIVAWTLVDAREATRRQAEQEGANITISLGREIDRMIGTLDLSLRAAAEGMATPGLATMPPNLQRSVLFDGAIAAEGVDGVFIADETGQIIYDTNRDNPRTGSIAEHDYFRTQRDHAGLGLVVSQPFRAAADGKWSVTLGRRIDHADGSFAGVVIAGLPLSYFQTLFDGLDIGSRGILNLVSTEHRELLARRPFVGREIGRSLSNSTVFTMLAQSPAGSFEAASQLDGINRIFSYRKVADLPLVIAVGMATDDVFAEWTQRAAILGGVLIVMSALKLWLASALPHELRLRVRAEEAARCAAAAAQRAAAELAQALAPIETLFRNTADTMLVIRVEPGGDFRYEAVNPTWEGVVGIPALAAIGQTPRELLPPDLADLVLASWRDCVRERRTTRAVLSFPPGSGREWEVMVFPIFGEDDTVGRLIVVGREITERNRLEGELRQAQKMEVIGRLAAGVSHDFNNILQVIGGGIETLRDEAHISAEAHEFLDMIDRAARRGAYLTHHLLAYSRKQSLHPKLLDLGEVIANLGSVLSRTLGTDIAVTVDVAKSVGFVLADRSQLETALMNLAINAAHAMPGGGTLRFEVTSAEAEEFGELMPGRHVVIAVTDSGTGMDPEVLARIFDPFFTTKGLDGTGLGLAMVQGFSRQSSGDVRATSTLGVGTRFEIWLPEVAAEAPRRQVAGPTRTHVATGRVLLVDDAADVLITLTAFLRAGGFSVSQAAGGKQALLMLQAGDRFDVLITDYLMPSMKGPELIRQARLFQPDLPAIVISGYADVSEFMTALPNATLLHKPFQRDQLIAEVAAMVAPAVWDPQADDHERSDAAGSAAGLP